MTATFPYEPLELSSLAENKNKSRLKVLGGVQGVLKSLKVDPNVGLASEIQYPSSLNVNEKHIIRKVGAEIDNYGKISDNDDSISNNDRRRIYGENRLPAVPPKKLWRFMWEALQDKLLVVLSFAAVAALAVGLYEDFGTEKISENCKKEPKVHWVEGAGIIVAILIVVLASSLNEIQKETQFRKLNDKKEDRKVQAIRDGIQQLIGVYDVLVGDVLCVEPGDMLCADGVFISGHNLKVDESAATGESDAIAKNRDADPFFLSGSKVIEGVGRFVVTGVGIYSFHGRTMMALRTDDQQTPLQVKLENLAEKIAKIGISVGAIMFFSLLLKYVITSLTTENGFGESPAVVSRIIAIIIATVTIVVVAVPEGLPLAVTLALAYAMTRMQKDNNLVRVLAACETMGGATTICSDKTGTLTQNNMTVVKGAFGRYFTFEELDDVPKMIERASALESVSTPFSLSALSVLSLVVENVAINSSAFDSQEEASNVKKFIGSKTECALLTFSHSLGFNFQQYRNHRDLEIVQVYPFSSERKCMSTVVKVKAAIARVDDVAPYPIVRVANKTGTFYRIYVKGASEIVLKYCEHIVILPQDSESIKSTTLNISSMHFEPGIQLSGDSLMREFKRLISFYAEQSLRTICMAYRDIEEVDFKNIIESLRGRVTQSVFDARSARQRHGEPGEIMTSEAIEAPYQEAQPEIILDEETILAHPLALAELTLKELTFLGVVGIEDPIRPGVPEAVKACQRAGVMVRMVTGDNMLTAKSIATRCGIYTRGGVVIEGARFREMSGAEMDAIIPRLQVMARSSPTDKQLLVGRLKALGETVAVTGDGTNDGPALKLADVGFSMGLSGTAVAIEASSIVLLDDNFASIVKAIMWGRSTTDSVKKFLQFQFTVNIAAVLLTYISAVADASQRSILSAVQLLWVNLIMNAFAALALATGSPSADILDRPPEKRNASLITRPMWRMIIGQSIYQLAIGLTLVFAGPQLLQLRRLRADGGIIGVSSDCTVFDYDVEASVEKDRLRAMVFNTFVFMQVFNLVNCRTLKDINIFRNIFKNPVFFIVLFGIIAGQILILFFGGPVFKTTPLGSGEWVASVLLGLGTWLWGLVIRLLPEEVYAFMTFGRYGNVSPEAEVSSTPSFPPEIVHRSPSMQEMTEFGDGILGDGAIHKRHSLFTTLRRERGSLDDLTDVRSIQSGRAGSPYNH